MGKPKLPEEDKKEVVPLRLPPAAIAAMDSIAERWGEIRGKEIKRATVARELVLIGLDSFAAIRNSRMFIELAQEVEGAEDQKARLAEITTIADDLLSKSKDKDMDLALIEKAIIQSLKAIKDALFGDLPIPAENLQLTPPPRYPAEPIQNRTKGGKK